jgi:hypothetical protein
MIIDLTTVPVYIINMDKDSEKLESATRNLLELGFTDIKRFPAQQIKTPKLGCATSHNELLKIISVESGPVLVVEDDIAISGNRNMEIYIPDDADAVYLGISMYGLYGGRGTRKVSAERISPDLYRLYNMLSAHAILYLNNEYSKFLVKSTEFMMSIKDNQDKSRASTMKFFKVYALNRPMFYQSGKYEHVTNIKLDSYRKNIVDKHDSM